MYRRLMLFLSSTILVLFMMISVISCSPARRPGPVNPSPVPTPTPSQPAPTPTPQNKPNGQTQESRRAEALAQKINDLQAIDSATVVLSGDRAWVGVNLAANARNLTDQLNDQITSIVKREDNKITRVYVTSDAKMVSRIRNIADDITHGKPVSDFVRDLNEMGNTITDPVR